MSDDVAKVEIRGDADEGIAAINEFAEKFENVFKSLMSGSIKDVLGAISQLPAAVTIAVGVLGELGEKIGETVGETARMVQSTQDFADRLGMPVSRAQALKSALEEVGVSSDTYAGASMRLTLRVRQHEAALNDMGVATRDASGHLLDTEQLMQNAIDTLGQYKAGTDRNAAALYMFGRGGAEAASLLRLLDGAVDENMEHQKALGLTITDISLHRFEDYRKAMHEAKETNEALSNQIGQALMPAQTALANWWGEVGPEAARLLREAIDVLIVAFNGLMAPIITLYDAIKLFFELTYTAIRALGEAVVDIAEGDFKSAGKVMADAWATAQRQASASAKEIADDAEKSATRQASAMDDLMAKAKGASLLEGAPAGRDGPPGSKLFANPDGNKQQMKQWEEQLQMMLFTEQKFGDDAKAIEAKFWADKLAIAKGNAQLYAEVVGKVYGIESEQAQKAAEAAKKAAAEQLQASVDAVKAEEAAAQQRFETVGKLLQEEVKDHEISKTEELRAEERLEEMSYESARQALERQLALYAQSPATSPAKVAELHAQIEALEQKHVDKMILLDKQMTTQMTSDWAQQVSSMEGSWSKGIVAMMNGTLTFSNALKRAWNSIIMSFEEMIAKQVAQWLLGEVQKTTIHAAQWAIRQARDAMGMTTGAATAKIAATQQVMTDAGVAAAGAMASISAIPYVGPFIAPGVAAETYAQTISWGATAAAEGGWDVPAGGDLRAQLHPREMVLPREQADVIRGLAGQGAPGGVNLHYNDYSGSRTPTGVADMKGSLAKAARMAMRAGSHVGGR